MLANRRAVLRAGLGAAATATAAAAKDAKAPAFAPSMASSIIEDIQVNTGVDQTAALQAAIDRAAGTGRVIRMPEGTIRTAGLVLRPGTCLIGQSRRTVLEFAGGAAFLTGENVDGIVLSGLVLDGTYKSLGASNDALLRLANSKDIGIEGCEFRSSAMSGLSLAGCSGRIAANTIRDCLDAGVKSVDAAGLDIHSNVVENCGNNGILVWRSAPGEDGTIVSSNRVAHIRGEARSGSTISDGRVGGSAA